MRSLRWAKNFCQEYERLLLEKNKSNLLWKLGIALSILLLYNGTWPVINTLPCVAQVSCQDNRFCRKRLSLNFVQISIKHPWEVDTFTFTVSIRTRLTI